MASALEEHSDYESDEKITLDMDLDLGTSPIGVFSIDVCIISIQSYLLINCVI